MKPVLVLTPAVAAYALYIGVELLCIKSIPDGGKNSPSIEERKEKLMRRARQLKPVLLVLFVLVTVSNLKR